MGLLQKMPRKVWSFLNIINRLIKKDNKTIFIYSNLGFYDNVKAMFDHLIDNGYNEKYKIVVSVGDYEKYIKNAEKNVHYVSTVKGLFKFFRSKYCFYCFGKYPVKPSKNQIVVNLWHGMPLKKIGNMIKGHEKTDYNYFTHLLCTSEFFRNIMKKSFNATDEQIFICGQPRTDKMLTPVPAEDEIKAKTALVGSNAKFSKIILWLPTFRENEGSELDILSMEQLAEIDRICGENGWCMIVKLHPLSSFDISACSEFENIGFANNDKLNKLNINLYSLLAMSSCLITDYSSVYFDYMLLDRPIGFAISDMDKYGSDRGFVFDNPLSMMPGDIITNGSEFLSFIKNTIGGKDDFANERKKLSQQLNKYCDNKNCERVLNLINENNKGEK